MSDDVKITQEILLQAYASGVFPMADGADEAEIYWVDPHQRGVFPIDGFHASRSLMRRIRKSDYVIKINSDFEGVVRACADRPETWINAEIANLYSALHKTGFAHSFEVWDQDGIFGGVYGVTLGSAFFGESMFSSKRDGSKIALFHLIQHLNEKGFTLFDTQFITDHLASLGAIEIEREDYHQRLRTAITQPSSFV